MPGYIARKLCPGLIILPCNFAKYNEASLIFREIVDNYDPNFESMGLDEANLDVTDYCQKFNISTDE